MLGATHTVLGATHTVLGATPTMLGTTHRCQSRAGAASHKEGRTVPNQKLEIRAKETEQEREQNKKPQAIKRTQHHTETRVFLFFFGGGLPAGHLNPIATQLLPNCYPTATQLLPHCYPTATQLLPNCYPTATPLLANC